MQQRNFIRPIISLISTALVIGGGYLIIDNLVQPKGMLFEGIISVVMGILISLVATVLTALDKTIQIFSEIFSTQVEIHNKIAKELNKKPNPGLGMFPGQITITDLDTGKTTDAPGNLDEAMKMVNQMILGSMNKNKKKELEDMNLEELETALAAALDKEDFKKASKIKKLIEDLKNPPAEGSEDQE